MQRQKELMQTQKQVSAYDKKTVHKMFRISLEWLEKYIEVVYPDYKIKKQIHDSNVTRLDANDPNRVESFFTTSLFGFKSVIELAGKPEFLYDEVKEEYYKWLGAAGIDVNNCPPRLKHFLFEINEVLEGRGDKLEKDIENRKWEIDPNSREYEEAVNKVFTKIQSPLSKEREEYENLKGKNHTDVKFENNFNDSGKRSKEAFEKIAGQHDYKGFNFLPQKDQEDDPQRRSNSEIIQDVKNYPQNWRFDEVITEYDSFGKAIKNEIALIHNSAEIGFDGAVSDAQQPVYLAGRFNQAEITEINQALNISQVKNYDNLTREQFIAETERLKAESEELKNNQTLTSSEKATKIQQNQQKLSSLYSTQFSNSNSNSNTFPSLAIGGTLLTVIGLVSFLVIRKYKKNK